MERGKHGHVRPLTMVAAIKENHDPLMVVDVAIAWKKTAHSGEPDRFAAVLQQFEGNSAALRYVDGFIEPEPGRSMSSYQTLWMFLRLGTWLCWLRGLVRKALVT